MSFQPILLPLLAQVLLTFLVWIYLYVTRLAEMRRKGIDPQDLYDRAVAQSLLIDSSGPANNFKNLMELPILFYVAVLLTMALLIQDPVLVKLAWGFVLMRALHSVVHCTYNRVMHRFTAYFVSCVFLFLMWVRLASYILTH